MKRWSCHELVIVLRQRNMQEIGEISWGFNVLLLYYEAI